MILLAVALLLGSSDKEGVCIAWRDPNSGKMLSSLEVGERANKTRAQVFNNDASDRSTLENARKPLECALRKAKEPPQK